MKYHTSLKELYDFTFKLTFGFDLKIFPPTNENPSECDVIFTTSCNSLKIEEFRAKLKGISQALISTELENLKEFGTEYKRELIELVIQLDRLQNDLFNQLEYKGIITDLPKTDIYDNDAYKLGALDYGKITTNINEKQEFYKLILDEFHTLKEMLSQEIIRSEKQLPDRKKLEWNTPRAAVLGGLLNELEKQNWITLPSTRGEVSYAKLASLCSEIFMYKGSETTLYNELKDKDRLSDTFRCKIQLPHIDEMS